MCANAPNSCHCVISEDKSFFNFKTLEKSLDLLFLHSSQLIFGPASLRPSIPLWRCWLKLICSFKSLLSRKPEEHFTVQCFCFHFVKYLDGAKQPDLYGFFKSSALIFRMTYWLLPLFGLQSHLIFCNYNVTFYFSK